MTWWAWVVVAAFLALMEMSGPGFFVIFFSVGAALTAAVLAAFPDATLWAQVGVFAGTSVVSLVLFRDRLAARFGQPKGAGETQDLLRDIAVALEDIAPGAVGRAELRGVPWSARNGSDAPLAKGQRCRVLKVDGLTLLLTAE
jgi:membrane protein implicated in regulation of membrane protease activity